MKNKEAEKEFLANSTSHIKMADLNFSDLPNFPQEKLKIVKYLIVVRTKDVRSVYQ